MRYNYYQTKGGKKGRKQPELERLPKKKKKKPQQEKQK